MVNLRVPEVKTGEGEKHIIATFEGAKGSQITLGHKCSQVRAYYNYYCITNHYY